MKSLFSKGLTGIAALLLAAAAIALMLFAFATLLGIAAVLGLVAAGVFIGAPADAKALVREVLAAIPKWLAQFEAIVANAGAMFLAALGRKTTDSSQNDESQPSSESAAAATDQAEHADASDHCSVTSAHR